MKGKPARKVYTLWTILW